MKTIREWRRDRCLSVADIAASLGVREYTVYRWERGTSTPSVIQGLALAKVLHVAAEDIDWPEDAAEVKVKERRHLIQNLAKA